MIKKFNIPGVEEIINWLIRLNMMDEESRESKANKDKHEEFSQRKQIYGSEICTTTRRKRKEDFYAELLHAENEEYAENLVGW